jgi:hypothetical protein
MATAVGIGILYARRDERIAFFSKNADFMLKMRLFSDMDKTISLLSEVLLCVKRQGRKGS